MNISSLQTDYLKFYRSSGFGKNSGKSHAVKTKCKFCGVTNHSAEIFFKRIRTEKEKAHAVYASYYRQTEHTPWECFRCGSEVYIIVKCPKPQKENEKQRKQVHFNEKGNCTCDNGEDNSDQKIYTSMTRLSCNDECPSEIFGDISQFTHLISDYGATCHMTPELSDFIPGSLEHTDKHI